MRTEYRKRNAEERNSARVACEIEKRKRKSGKKSKTEDEATQEEGRGERNKGGMTTRMARSYSLGYNSAVLGQCKLNESFSPRRTDDLTSPFSSFSSLFPVCRSRRCRRAHRTVLPVQQRKHQTKGTMKQKCPTDLDRLMRTLKHARKLPVHLLFQNRQRGAL